MSASSSSPCRWSLVLQGRLPSLWVNVTESRKVLNRSTLLIAPIAFFQSFSVQPLAQSTRAQGHVQLGLEYIQDWQCHNLHGQSLTVCNHPRDEKLPLLFMWSYISVCAFGLLPCPRAPLASISLFFAPIGYLYTLMRFTLPSPGPSPLLQTKQSRLSQPLFVSQMLKTLHHPCDPLLTLSDLSQNPRM